MLEVVAVVESFSLRLSGTDRIDGEITFARAPAIFEAMQTLSTRLGQHHVGRQGPGRPVDGVRRATELRLVGLRPGSTILDVRLGDEDVLLDMGIEHQVTDSLFELFAGVSENSPPAWTTPTLGEATLAVVDAFGAAASEVDLSSETRGRRVAFRPGDVERAVWPGADGFSTPELGVSVSGRLDRGDLRSSRFRVRDGVGNDIVLERVEDVGVAAGLLGSSVVATGTAERNRNGRIVRIRSAIVQPAKLPDGVVTTPRLPDLSGAVPTVIPDDGIPGITDDEVDDFLSSLKG